MWPKKDVGETKYLYKFLSRSSNETCVLFDCILFSVWFCAALFCVFLTLFLGRRPSSQSVATQRMHLASSLQVLNIESKHAMCKLFSILFTLPPLTFNLNIWICRDIIVWFTYIPIEQTFTLRLQLLSLARKSMPRVVGETRYLSSRQSFHVTAVFQWHDKLIIWECRVAISKGVLQYFPILCFLSFNCLGGLLITSQH